MIWVTIIGFCAGIISGMGVGGGAILIPALLIILDMEQKNAQAINLIYFIPAAITALIKHKKSGNLESSIIKPLILSGLLGAAIGSVIALNLESNILKKLFGAFLIFMGIKEILYKEKIKE